MRPSIRISVKKPPKIYAVDSQFLLSRLPPTGFHHADRKLFRVSASDAVAGRNICKNHGFSFGTAAFLGAAFLLAGCHSATSLTGQESAGKLLYQMRCAHCHEDNDLGLKKIPPDLHHLFEHKTLPSGAPATDAMVRQTVLEGKGMMPSFRDRFTEDQMAALQAYLHTELR